MPSEKLVTVFKLWRPDIMETRTYRLIGVQAGVLKYLEEETGMVVCMRHLEPIPEYEEKAFVASSPEVEIPRAELPIALAAMRYCRFCKRYSAFIRCPYCRKITLVCRFYE